MKTFLNLLWTASFATLTLASCSSGGGEGEIPPPRKKSDAFER